MKNRRPKQEPETAATVQGGPAGGASQYNGNESPVDGENWIKVPIDPPQRSSDTLLKKYSTEDMTRKA